MTEKRTAKYLFQKVEYFKRGMLVKLHQNNHKPHWKDQSLEWLQKRLDEEVVELKDAIKSGVVRDIIRETWDVANFAMMIADNVRRNADAKTKQRGTGLLQQDLRGNSSDKCGSV